MTTTYEPDTKIAELEADVAQRDLRIKFLEGQCDLLAREIDRLLAELKEKE